MLAAAVGLVVFDLGTVGNLLLGALADFDSDGNGTRDSFSVGFSFVAVPCQLITDAE